MQECKNLIKQYWLKNSFEGSRPGLQISPNIDELRKLVLDKAPPSLHEWVFVFDEYISWFSSLVKVYLDALSNESTLNDPLKGAQIRAFSMLSSAITSHLMAIRSLIFNGHDLAAKQVLRSLVEYSDVATLLSFNKDALFEFLDTQTKEKSNAFWHRYISKGKALASIEKKLHELKLPQSSIDELRSYREEELGVLGMGAHPSFIACYMAFTGGADPLEYPGFLGRAGEASIRTLQYSMFSLCYFLILGPSDPFEHKNTGLSLIKFDETDELHFHTERGKSLLINLYAKISRVVAAHSELSKGSE